MTLLKTLKSSVVSEAQGERIFSACMNRKQKISLHDISSCDDEYAFYANICDIALCSPEHAVHLHHAVLSCITRVNSRFNATWVQPNGLFTLICARISAQKSAQITFLRNVLEALSEAMEAAGNFYVEVENNEIEKYCIEKHGSWLSTASTFNQLKEELTHFPSKAHVEDEWKSFVELICCNASHAAFIKLWDQSPIKSKNKSAYAFAPIPRYNLISVCQPAIMVRSYYYGSQLGDGFNERLDAVGYTSAVPLVGAGYTSNFTIREAVQKVYLPAVQQFGAILDGDKYIIIKQSVNKIRELRFKENVEVPAIQSFKIAEAIWECLEKCRI